MTRVARRRVGWHAAVTRFSADCPFRRPYRVTSLPIGFVSLLFSRPAPLLLLLLLVRFFFRVGVLWCGRVDPPESPTVDVDSRERGTAVRLAPPLVVSVESGGHSSIVGVRIPPLFVDQSASDQHPFAAGAASASPAARAAPAAGARALATVFSGGNRSRGGCCCTKDEFEDAQCWLLVHKVRGEGTEALGPFLCPRFC